MPSTRRWRAGGRRSSPVDVPRREECIEIALKNKLAERAAKRELDALAAQREIAEFTGDFLNAARKCFELIDKDGGGTLSTAEIVNAVKTDEEVIKFLRNCGEENLQFLLQPARPQEGLEVLDEDGSGEIDIDECAARRLSLFIRSTRRPLDGVAVRFSGRATWSRLTGRLARRGASDPARPLEAARPAGRGARAAERAAAKADAEFSAEFLSMARKCFDLIDKDGPGPSRSPRSCRPCAPTRSRTRRPTTARPSTCEDSAELLFSCVWCVVVQNRTTAQLRTHTHTKEQLHDRFTLRLRDRS